MIKNYITTIGSRYLIAILNLVVVLLTSRYLGAEGLGFVSLFVLGLALNQQICSFLGGGALVYLATRHSISTLLFISQAAAVLIHLILLPVYFWMKPFDTVYFIPFFLVSLINTWLGNNLSILLGKEKILYYNLFGVVQVIIQVIVFVVCIFSIETLSVHHYIFATTLGYTCAFGLSLAGLSGYFKWKAENKVQTFKELIRYGFFAETGNIFQLLAYRLNFFLINKWLGVAALGEFSLAVQLTESIRIFSKGIATVEYARFSNSALSTKKQYSGKALFSGIAVTLIGLTVLLLLPDSFFTYVLGQKFHNLKTIMIYLAPGILLLSAGTILAPFFSGQGKHYINAIGSAICFGMTAIFSFILIPVYELTGAALANTIAYSGITLYLFLVFLKYQKPQNLGI